MANLEEVYTRLREKKKQRAEIARMFKDELENEPRYKEIVDQMKALRDEKKSIENAAYAHASRDAEKLDLLKLDIKSDSEMLSDIAINMYTEGRPVEVVDEYNTRWVPNFSVRFVKDAENVETHVPAIEIAGAKLSDAHAPKLEIAGGALEIPRFNPNDR